VGPRPYTKLVGESRFRVECEEAIVSEERTRETVADILERVLTMASCSA
jgi:hypothetical protein